MFSPEPRHVAFADVKICEGRENRNGGYVDSRQIQKGEDAKVSQVKRKRERERDR